MGRECITGRTRIITHTRGSDSDVATEVPVRRVVLWMQTEGVWAIQGVFEGEAQAMLTDGFGRMYKLVKQNQRAMYYELVTEIT